SDTNADPGVDLVPVDRDRFADSVDETACEQFGVGGRALPQQYREFVATEPRDRILGIEDVGKPLADALQKLVSDRVPKRVVDRFEIVQIEAHDSHRFFAGLNSCKP